MDRQTLRDWGGALWPEPKDRHPQAWNRYSYVANDPLAFTDPSGYSWLSSFFSQLFSNPLSIVKSFIQIASTVVLTAVLSPVLGPGAPIAAAGLWSAVVTDLSGDENYNLFTGLRAQVSKQV